MGSVVKGIFEAAKVAAKVGSRNGLGKVGSLVDKVLTEGPGRPKTR